MSDEQGRTRPKPHPTSVSEPFWAAARRHELLIQHCRNCGERIFYPRATCPACGSPCLMFEPASGWGMVYSFTIARRPTHPRLAGLVPYVIAIIALDEGPHLTSTVIDSDPEALRIGDRVRVGFEDNDDFTLPIFRRTT